MWKCLHGGEIVEEACGSCEKCGTDKGVLPPSDYFEQRANRGSRAAFEQALAKASAAPPDAGDALE